MRFLEGELFVKEILGLCRLLQQPYGIRFQHRYGLLSNILFIFVIIVTPPRFRNRANFALGATSGVISGSRVWQLPYPSFFCHTLAFYD